MSRIGATELRDAVLDPGSFRSWDSPPPAVTADAEYAAELARARAATGLDEAVLTGEGTVFGRRVAVVACEFGFLAGSIGVAAAERITAAVERATAERLPLLASPSSGGTRMQEGTVAFLQMVKIAAAVTVHKQAHLPYLVYLRNPTTGGVFASWGSLGHVTVAQPGALIGFLGPRVYEQLYGEPFPAGVQTAENLLAHGVIDGVVPLESLRPTLDRALRVLVDPPAEPPAADPAEPIPEVPAWESVMASRRPDRPGVGWLLREGATDRVLLSGTHGEAAATRLLGGDPAAVAFASVPWFWSDQYDAKIQMAGRPDGDDELHVVDGTIEDGRFVVAFRRGERCTGVLGVNRPRLVMQARMRLRESLAWEPVAELFR